jgi:hypothetical protein
MSTFTVKGRKRRSPRAARTWSRTRCSSSRERESMVASRVTTSSHCFPQKYGMSTTS